MTVKTGLVTSLGMAMIVATAACDSSNPTPTPDLPLSGLTGTYSPITVSDQLTLSAELNGGGTPLTQRVSSSLVGNFDSEGGLDWNAIAVVYNAPTLTLIANPDSNGNGTDTIAVDSSKITHGTDTDSNDNSYISSYSFQLQVGQTMSSPVSSACETVTKEMLTMTFSKTNFSALIEAKAVFNDITSSSPNSAVTCKQLLSSISLDIKSGIVDSQYRIFSVMVANGVMTADQVAYDSSVSITTVLNGNKSSSSPGVGPQSTSSAPASFEMPAGSLLQGKLPSRLSALHNGLVHDLKAAAARL